jgi:hypothetical protein
MKAAIAKSVSPELTATVLKEDEGVSARKVPVV